MNRFCCLIVTTLALSALSACGGGAGSTAMTYTPHAARQPSKLPGEYKFVFVNKTSTNLEVTRLRDDCMSSPPPKTFTVRGKDSATYTLQTKCLIDPSTFTLAFVSDNKSIDVDYTKETGNPWRVRSSNANGLKFDFDEKVIVIGGSAFDSYHTTISLR